MEYLLHLVIIISIYGTLALSLDLVAGQTGYLSLCHASFFGMGAYATAILSLSSNAVFINLAAATLLPCLVAFLLSPLLTRLRGDYFAIATFSLQVITSSIVTNWIAVTGGSIGLSGILRPSFLDSQLSFSLLSLSLCTLTLASVNRISKSPLGRVLGAIRGNEEIAIALGKDVLRVKAVVLMLSATFAGAAGSIYTYYFSFIDPSSFSMTESIFILSMVVLGGAGSPLGVLLGTTILVLLPESLRFVGLTSSFEANFRQIIYSSALLGTLIFRPAGLLGSHGLGGKSYE